MNFKLICFNNYALKHLLTIIIQSFNDSINYKASARLIKFALTIVFQENM